MIQTSWPLPTLSPWRGSSAGRGEARCGRLHLPGQHNHSKNRFLVPDAGFRYEQCAIKQAVKTLLTIATCMECLSASLYTATERTPIFLAVRITRHAISPRLAINTFSIRPTPGQDTVDTNCLIMLIKIFFISLGCYHQKCTGFLIITLSTKTQFTAPEEYQHKLL